MTDGWKPLVTDELVKGAYEASLSSVVSTSYLRPHPLHLEPKPARLKEINICRSKPLEVLRCPSRH
jgi:hypothetical protein